MIQQLGRASLICHLSPWSLRLKCQIKEVVLRKL